MARHSQKPARELMVCSNCKQGVCDRCLDVLRKKYTNNPLCQCMRREHKATVGMET